MERNPYYDFLRGFAILLVIGIHSFGYCGFDTIDSFIRVVAIETLNCAVPLFIALSGFFMSSKEFTSIQSCMTFWKKQILRVYVPMLLFALPLLIAGILNGKSIANQLVLYLSGGYSIYYFIPLIIQYYIILPVLLKCRNHQLILISSIVSFISVIIIAYSGAHSLPFLFYMAPAPTWIFFSH